MNIQEIDSLHYYMLARCLIVIGRHLWFCSSCSTGSFDHMRLSYHAGNTFKYSTVLYYVEPTTT
jgi:hypothetical protein